MYVTGEKEKQIREFNTKNQKFLGSFQSLLQREEISLQLKRG
jgi:hypothetical protein